MKITKSRKTSASSNWLKHRLLPFILKKYPRLHVLKTSELAEVIKIALIPVGLIY